MKKTNTIKSQNWIPTRKFFSDAFLIAVLTGVGYLSAFAYQFSYLHYFGIPVLFVDVDLRSVLVAASIGFICSLSLVPHFDLLVSFRSKSRSINIIKVLFATFTIITIIAVPILALFFNLSNDLVFIIILAAIAVLVVGLAVYAYKYPQKVEGRQKEKSKSLLFLAEELFGSFPVLFVVISALFVIYCGGMGAIVAQNTRDYLVSNTNPELVIVSTYSGNFVGLTFNRNTKTFDQSIKLISQDKVSNDAITFSTQKVGPLKPN